MSLPRGNPIPLSYEERKKIYEFLQQGLTYKSIAKQIFRHAGTIETEITRGKGPLSYCPHKAQQDYEKRKASGHAKHRCHYTDEEKKSLEKCISEGFTKNKMSVQTGITYFRVIQYLKKNHPGYKASPDQKRKEKISLEGRICSIEMQIEILIEKIKELNEQN